MGNVQKGLDKTKWELLLPMWIARYWQTKYHHLQGCRAKITMLHGGISHGIFPKTPENKHLMVGALLREAGTVCGRLEQDTGIAEITDPSM